MTKQNKDNKIEEFEKMVDLSVKPSNTTRSGWIAEFDLDYIKEYFAVKIDQARQEEREKLKYN